jgi:hypothetical protein
VLRKGDDVTFGSLQTELGLGALPNSLAAQTGLEFMRNAAHGERAVSASLPPAKATALTEVGENNAARAGVGKAMDTCQVCVYTLERIKQGYQFLLPAICVELFSKEKTPKDGQSSFAICHQVLAALSVWGNNVRHWFHYGCYKSETYGAMELIRPCPSQVICSQMSNFEKTPFCEPEEPDKLVKGKKPKRL